MELTIWWRQDFCLWAGILFRKGMLGIIYFFLFWGRRVMSLGENGWISSPSTAKDCERRYLRPSLPELLGLSGSSQYIEEIVVRMILTTGWSSKWVAVSSATHSAPGVFFWGDSLFPVHLSILQIGIVEQTLAWKSETWDLVTDLSIAIPCGLGKPLPLDFFCIFKMGMIIIPALPVVKVVMRMMWGNVL